MASRLARLEQQPNGGSHAHRLGDVRELRESPDKGRAAEEVDIVVAQIKRLARNASLEFALRVGAVVIHHFYAGDTEAWRSRGPKTSSFRRLARHPDLPLSAGSLYRCVALFELCERLNAVARWQHLGASHLRQVLGLPPAAQERILGAANANRWTVKSLQREVSLESAQRRQRGGRRAAPPIEKSLKNLEDCLEDHRSLLEAGDGVTMRDLQQSIQLIDDARSSLEALSRLVQTKMAGAGSPTDANGHG